MFKRIGITALMIVSLVGMIGCDGGLIMGSKSMGVRSGEFIYMDGYVISSYNDSFERVWGAVESVIKDMKAYNVEKQKKIAKGSIIALVSEEKISIKVEFMERDKVSVAVLVGMGGSRIAAGAIHDKITQKLAKP